MTRKDKHKAQDKIVLAAVNEALRASEDGDENLAEAIRQEATRLAKRYGLTRVYGLPGTFQ